MQSKYTIGEISKLLGLSAQAIRYYEKKEIIVPDYCRESGYRYYNTWDFHMLLRARYYRGLGFSLEETAKILKSENLEYAKEKLCEQEEKIKKEIILKMNLLKRIEKNKSAVADYQKEIGKFSLRIRPGIYRIKTQDNYSLTCINKKTKNICTWTENASFLFSTAVFPKEFIKNKNKNFSFGLGMEEEFFSFLGLEKNEDVEYFPPCICIYTCISSRSGKTLTYENLEKAFEYIKENNFEISGDIITQIFSMSKPENEYFNWHNVWIPVKLNS